MSSIQNFGYIQEKIILSKVRGFSWTVLISIINNLIIYHSYFFYFQKTINFPFKQNEKSIVFWKRKRKLKWTCQFLFGSFIMEKKSVKFGDHVNLEKCSDWLTLTCTDLFDTVWCFVWDDIIQNQTWAGNVPICSGMMTLSNLSGTCPWESIFNSTLWFLDARSFLF